MNLRTSQYLQISGNIALMLPCACVIEGVSVDMNSSAKKITRGELRFAVFMVFSMDDARWVRVNFSSASS